MPYRRLPTTDKARLRALNAAINNSAKRKENKLAFSKHSLEQLKLVKTNFENTLRQYEVDSNAQLEKNKDYKKVFTKTAMYISHFVRVLYMVVEREEIKKEALAFYGLEKYDGKVPLLNSEEEILYWGNVVVKGEKKRIQNGGSAIYNPSIALVKIKVEEFNDMAIFMQNLKKISGRSFDKMKEARKSTNDFISRLWTEIEEKLQYDSETQKRLLAQEYGIVYIFRRKEKKQIKTKGLQTDLIFDFN